MYQGALKISLKRQPPSPGKVIFTLRGKDDLIYQVTVNGSPINSSDKALACLVMARYVSVRISGERFGNFSLLLDVPGHNLISSRGNIVSFKELNAKELLSANLHVGCKITRRIDKEKKQIKRSITVHVNQLLTPLGEFRPLEELFAEFTKPIRNTGARRASTFDATQFDRYGENWRLRQGHFALCITGEPTVALNVMQLKESDILRAVVAYPEYIFKIERVINKQKSVVSVLGKQLLTAEAQLRPLSEVFEEVYKVRIHTKTVFQPKNIPWRICFQLEDPSSRISGQNASEGDWGIRVLFQSAKDLSLLVPSLRETTGYNAAKYVHVLEKAALRFPLLDRWLKQGKPQVIVLTFDEVVHFLETSGPELEKAGFGVRLPSWMLGGDSTKRISVVAHGSEIGEHRPGHLTLASVMRINWRVCLGEDYLSLEEIEVIARLKTPLLKMRGKWVYLTAEEIQAVARLLRDGFTGQFSAQEIVRLMVDGKNAEGLPVRDVVATERWKDVLKALSGTITFQEQDMPAGLEATLRPYQRRGFSWLVFMAQTGMGACLADDMGLGKTVQTLAFLQHQWETSQRKPTLLVCPTSIMENWRREARIFTPRLLVGIHHGLKRASKAGESFQRFQDHALVITSYALLGRDADIIHQINWAGVILDEAQNIKNPDTLQAKTARSLPAAFRIALTGTPVENTVADLWSIMEFLNPGYLGTRREFEKQFLSPLQQEDSKVAVERLKQLTRPFLLRRLKTDPDVCPDLPAKLESKVFCTLTPEQATLYATVLNGEWDTVANSAGGQRSISVLRLIAHLKQVCNHPVQYLKDRSELPNRSGKLERLTEILDTVRTMGKAALVFTQYQEMGDPLRQHLSSIFGEKEVLFLHGGIPVEDRKKMTDSFQAKDGPAIFIRSIKAGGTGETLTRATHVIHFDRWWNPAVENQATDRAHRIGQHEVVYVHKLICAGTLEDRIDQMIDRKSAMMGQVMDAGDHWLADLSTDELRELVALDDEVIGG